MPGSEPPSESYLWVSIVMVVPPSGTQPGWWFGCHFLLSHPNWEFHHPNWLSYVSEGWPNHQPAAIDGWWLGGYPHVYESSQPRSGADPRLAALWSIQSAGRGGHTGRGPENAIYLLYLIIYIRLYPTGYVDWKIMCAFFFWKQQEESQKLTCLYIFGVPDLIFR